MIVKIKAIIIPLKKESIYVEIRFNPKIIFTDSITICKIKTKKIVKSIYLIDLLCNQASKIASFAIKSSI